jgi:CRISPR-associated protein Cmr3
MVLEPLDTLFFRGGRPFGAGLPGESSLPSPQSLAGMLRTFLLDREHADFAAMRGKADIRDAFDAAGVPWLAEVCFRGPWIAEDLVGGPRPLVRAPSDLRMVDGKVVRLSPTRQKIPGWQAPLPGMHPLWRTGAKPSKDRPELISLQGLSSYLSCEEPRPQDVRSYREFLLFEDRTGIGIDPATYASKEGEIFSTRNLRLRSGVAFYAEVDVPNAGIQHFESPTTLTWGGEKHHVIMRRVQPVRWPEAPVGDRIALLLLSPAFFNRGWQPDAIREGQLRAAAVEGPYAISGWDWSVAVRSQPGSALMRDRSIASMETSRQRGISETTARTRLWDMGFS